MRRRSFLALASTAGLGAALHAGPVRMQGAPFGITADFEPTRAVWLGWDAGHQDFTADLVRLLRPRMALKMLVRDSAAGEEARAGLLARSVAFERIEFLQDPLASYFIRDAAVFAAQRAAKAEAAAGAGALGVIDFAWGQYGHAQWCRTRHAADVRRRIECEGHTDLRADALDRRIAELAGAALRRSPLVTEGGAVEVNGRGTMIANAEFLHLRNPQLKRAQLHRLLLDLPGMRHVLWLPHGLAEDPPLRATITGPYVAWGTGGHTDEFVRFADARTVLLAWPDDADAASHPVARLNRQRMQRNLAVLAAARNADGERLRVLKVPMPTIIEREVVLKAEVDPARSEDWSADYFAPQEGRREGQVLKQVATSSYLNFIVANGLVLLPDYLPHGTPAARQQRVQGIFEQAFPRHEIRFIDSIGANWVGGGPHCATLNEPEV